jgi:signal transduction histidine kinase
MRDRDWRRPTTAWLIVLGAVFATEYAVHLALRSLMPDQPTQLVEATADALALTAVVSPLLWWRVVRPLREVIRLRNNFLAALFTHLEADRRQIARDLHDGIGQSLSLLVSGLRTAREVAGIAPESARRCADLQQLAQAALADVKRLALGLRPSLLDDLGLAPALERVVADVGEHHPIALTLDISEVNGKRLPGVVETAVFRIVQEALANVIKHSEATHAAVEIRSRDNDVQVAITDDGRGIRSAAINGQAPYQLGLSGMRERAEVLGGNFLIESSAGEGTRIVATIPTKG